MSDNMVSHTEPMVNPEDAKAIAEAQAKDPVVAPEAPAAPAAPEAPVAPEAPAAPAVSRDLSEIIQPFQQELATTGQLAPESIQKLSEALNIPQDLVKYTYAGMKQVQEQKNNAVLNEAGGSEAYSQMVKWAGDVYSPEEAEAFNRALYEGNQESAIGAIQQLKRKFTEVNGSFQPKAPAPAAPSVPVRSTGASAIVGAPTVKPFGSLSELMSAQKDVRYGKDPAYTAQVYQRAAVSKI